MGRLGYATPSPRRERYHGVRGVEAMGSKGSRSWVPGWFDGSNSGHFAQKSLLRSYEASVGGEPALRFRTFEGQN